MKDKILALLIAKFTGVRKDGLAQLAGSLALQADDETAATALIEKLTPEKVSAFVTDWRKDVDGEVTKANKTHEENLKKKFDFTEKKTEPNPPTPAPTTIDPSNISAVIAAAVAEAMKPLQQELSVFKGQRTTETRLDQLSSKLKDVPETFKNQKLKDFKRMNFESDEAFTEYLSEVEKDATDFSQELANTILGKQSRPAFGEKGSDGVSVGVSQYIAAKSADSQSAKNMAGKPL